MNGSEKFKKILKNLVAKSNGRQILSLPNIAKLTFISSIVWFFQGYLQNAIFFAIISNILFNLAKQKN